VIKVRLERGHAAPAHRAALLLRDLDHEQQGHGVRGGGQEGVHLVQDHLQRLGEHLVEQGPGHLLGGLGGRRLARR
jgi:hypothetical protein